MASAARLAVVAVVLAAFTVAANTHFPNPTAQQEKDPEFWYRLNREALQQRLKTEKFEGRANNVILFIGDGMGISTISAARVFKGQLTGTAGENSALSFEKFPHTSLSKVYCADRLVPDSACSGTAIQCGVKSNYFTLGVSAHVRLGNCSESSDTRHHLKCLYELAQEADKTTGFVTTAGVTDATVAAGYAHSAHREWESSVGGNHGSQNCLDIAHQLVHRPPGLHLRFIAGGGREHFLVPEEAQQTDQPGKRPDSRNLIEEWSNLKQSERMNSHVCNTKEDVEKLDTATADAVLALLASGDLPYENLDGIREGTSLLTKLTEKAIRILSKNPDGFLLLVEGMDEKPHQRTLLNYAVGPGFKKDYSNLTSEETSHEDFVFPSVYPEKAGTHSGEDVAVFAYGPYAHLFSGVHEQTYIYEVIRYAAGLDEASYPTRRQSLLAALAAWIPGPVKYALVLAVIFYFHMFIKAFL
ncbi:alkaline phosphatase, tissue-nonspecific isozyme-like isoform X2 [Rhipicephalus microplus]|uniref:alkaline phosphatase, tissue-nonspecific isozyme-like isoform X2 n=1 Tax=Rhipicephalus microplus TaxID=6941 RepID=UPI003F6B8AE1